MDDKLHTHWNAMDLFDRIPGAGKARSRRFFIILLVAVIAALLFLCIWFGRSFLRLCPVQQLQYGAEGSDPTILVIQTGDRYGYGDTAGNVLLPPVYEDARPFFEGLAAVKLKGKYGYIDETGNTVISFRFVDALDFHEGNAVVGTKWEVAGFLRYRPDCCIIDRAGNVLREVNVSSLGEYREGLYKVAHSEFMDCAGNLIYYDSDLGYFPSGFHEGMAKIYIRGEYGFVDRMGNLVRRGLFGAGDFSGGLAPAEYVKWGFVDRTGAFAIEPQFEEAFGFGGGLACVKRADGKWIIIDARGNETCEVQCSAQVFGSFSEGLCAAGGAVWGFIDTAGRLAIDYKYEKVTPFVNGVAEVMVLGHIGYIDSTGKYIWQPK